MTLLELVVALSILAIAFLGLAASLGAGFRAVALSRQRQTAADVANGRLERLRDVPYGSLALSTAPQHNLDPASPDYLVSATGTQYDVTGKGTNEPLIVDAAGGTVLHLEDPVTVGSTVMEIYQYVTWVDDPTIPGTQDFKRVTVVVRFKTPAVNGVSLTVRGSSLFTPDSVTLPNTPPTTSVVSTTTTLPTTTTTTPVGCVGDLSAPTGGFTIPAGAGATVGFTATPSVTLLLSFADNCIPLTAIAQFSNDGVTFGPDMVYDPANPTAAWSLAPGDGSKTVYGKVRDAAGNTSALTPQTIVLDTTRPTVPGVLSALACTTSATDRTVQLQWGTSTDTNFSGYRVYRSTTNPALWAAITTTVATNATDTTPKNSAVSYYVIGYDKAGNESNATNTRAYASKCV